MRSLFLKIFLWFWAAQLLIGVALAVFSAATQRSYDEQLRNIVSASLEDRARAAAITYEVGGLTALRQSWRRAPARDDGPPPQDEGAPPDAPPRRDPIDEEPTDAGRPDDRPPDEGPPQRQWASFYLLKSSRKAAQGAKAELTPVLLAGPPVAPDAASLLTRAQPGGPTLTLLRASTTFLARAVQTPRGERYVAVSGLRASNRGPRFLSDYFRFGPGPGVPVRLLVVGLTMGVVCFALARYLTDPAIKLRRATREFAAGDFSARVGSKIGRRRDELADLGRDFDLMAEQIENLLLAQRRLLGDISHELRSPLTRLQLALDLAEQTADEPTRNYLARIGTEAEELNALIGQLLTLTRLESNRSAAGTVVGAKDYIDLGRLVTHICHNADFEARARGGSVEIIQNRECDIEGNGELLHSALENVVRNAILHSPEAPQVEVSLAVEVGSTAIIRVRDYGPGVPTESLPLLFQPFYRVAQARDRQSGGTGLGLSITQRAVEFHGGKVEAFNAPGGGLLVEIRLPLGSGLPRLEAEKKELY